jgi:DNA-binding NarL/FixJ family response regulator
VLRVLIVDDEALVALTLEAMVQDMGHEVAGAAANPANAVALALQTDPDVVLMDVRLGRIGDEGIATAMEIRARTRAAIVFVTAYADGNTMARIKTAVPGARVLAKPVSDTELAEAIDAAAGS